MSTLIIPGLHGSEAEHWQWWWEYQDPMATRVHQDNWHYGDLTRWSERVASYVLASREPVWLVAHSFGCLASIHASQDPVVAQKIAGAFLVAPADPVRFGIDDHEVGIKPPFPSMFIASNTDPYLRLDKAFVLAKLWGSQLINLGNVGHINVASGFGPWPKGKRLFDLFRSQYEQDSLLTWRLSA